MRACCLFGSRKFLINKGLAMKSIYVLVLTLAAVLTAQQTCASTLSSKNDVEHLLASYIHGAKFYSANKLEVSSKQISVSVIGFQLEQSSSDYGSVISVVDSKSGDLLWVRTVYGDFGPHTIKLIDFDGDNRDDLWVLAGFEDVFSTELFLNRIDSQQFSLTNFVPGFSSQDVYATLLDFNKDGYPEIMFPKGPVTNEGMSDQYIEKANCLSFSDEVIQLAMEEYYRLVGKFESANFDFNLKSYPAFSLFIDSNVEILSKYPKNKFVTNEYSNHFNWRRDLISKRISESDEGCKKIISDNFK